MKSKLKKIVPTITLLIVCAVSALLLVFVHDLTSVRDESKVTPEILTALDEIYGESKYFSVIDTPVAVSETTYVSIAMRDGGNSAYVIVSDGYSKEGLTLLVGLDENGAVKGIKVLSSLETPGLGSKVNSPEYMAQFEGYTYNHLPAPEAPDNTKYKVRFPASDEELLELKTADVPTEQGFDFDAITGATLSSNGVYEAVKLAVIANREV
ncbi:MAG: FMN-binding protein [Ruminococcus sp.]|jgi:electron transport complex protein RnfG|nr:FMN-binding protein [Ruminococcus sp.]